VSAPPTKPPIFILGVARSGTTLLRTILDSHSNIACGPESPWLAGPQARSIRELTRHLREDPYGYSANFHGPIETVNAAARAFASHLLADYAHRRGKQRWAEKTPDNILEVPFLLQVFPDAKYIFLGRDGLDVAFSTSVIPPERRGISDWHEKHLPLGAGIAVTNTPFAAVLRWRHWSRLAESALAGHEHFRLSYERLVSEPEPTLRELMAFLDEPFDPSMLEHSRQPHDFPAWEWGSADLKQRPSITKDRIGRARAALGPAEYEILAPLARPAPDASSPPAAALASMRDLHEPRFSTLMNWINAFAGPLELRTFTTRSKIWEYPWLWFHTLSRVDFARTRLVDLGSELSPVPWIAALLGAKVTLIETDSQFVPLWTKLRNCLRVNLDWHIVSSEKLPLESASADLLTSFSVIEHQPDKPTAIAEAARILKPRGIFALSFDICEPDLGMTFPRWNGEALTLADFERLIWRHPAFAAPETAVPPPWNKADIQPFLDWHRTTAKHHNYIVAAATLRRA
jgi:SAM-dependent methyltransferase